MRSLLFEDYEITIPNGGSVTLPSGNYFFCYSIAGSDTLTATFYDSRQASAKCVIRAGIQMGDGYPAQDGGYIFDKVIISNTSGAAVSAVFYLSSKPVRANRFSGSVDVNSLPAGETAASPLYVVDGARADSVVKPFICSFEGSVTAYDRAAVALTLPASLGTKKALIKKLIFTTSNGECEHHLVIGSTKSDMTTDAYWSTAADVEAMCPGASITEVEYQTVTNVSSTSGGGGAGGSLWVAANHQHFGRGDNLVVDLEKMPIELTSTTDAFQAVTNNTTGSTRALIISVLGEVVQ